MIVHWGDRCCGGRYCGSINLRRRWCGAAPPLTLPDSAAPERPRPLVYWCVFGCGVWWVLVVVREGWATTSYNVDSCGPGTQRLMSLLWTLILVALHA